MSNRNIGNLEIEAREQSVALWMRHVIPGNHQGCLIAYAELPLLISILQGTLDKHKAGSIAQTGTNCAECGAPQFETPSGVTCKNGHGGSPSLDQDDEDLL